MMNAMNIKRVIARNVVWNIAGMATAMLAGFVVAPFLVHRLGETTYGLWILIASLTGYFGLLDLGVRGSVGRYIAYHLAQNDQEGVNATLNTALALLGGVAGITVLGTLGICLVFFHLFEVPADQVANARLALMIVGVNLAVSFPLTLFDATLWAYQRFDILNVIDIPIALGRVFLTFALINDQDGLVTLAVITLLTGVAAGVAKMVVSFRLNPDLRLSPALVRRAVGRKIYAYGIWHFLLEIALMLSNQMSVLIIGIWASVALVTSYSVASRLIAYASSLLIACTGVLTPVATAFDAEQDERRQQRLFLHGGQFCMVFALFFLGLFLFLGKPLIMLWMGSDLADASRWLAILAIGQVLPMSQWVTHGMILAMGRHRFTACVSLVEAAVATGVGILLIKPYGIAGVCGAFALASVVSRGLIQMTYGCRLVHLSIERYIAQALLLPLLGAAGPLACLAVLTRWQIPANWLTLIAHTTFYTLVYLVTAYLILCRWEIVPAGNVLFLQKLKRISGLSFRKSVTDS